MSQRVAAVSYHHTGPCIPHLRFAVENHRHIPPTKVRPKTFFTPSRAFLDFFPMSSKTPISPVFSAILILSSAGHASAAIVADDFGANRYGWLAEDGVGTWSRVPNGTNANAYTTSTNPVVPGGGTYLGFRTRMGGTVDEPIASPSGNYGVGKKLDSAALNTTVAHTVTFDFRWDSALTTFTSFADRVHIAGSANTNTNTNATTTWSVGVVGGSSGSTAMTPLVWYFHDRNISNAIITENMYFTAVPLVPGVTYSFVIQVDPATASYSASITSSVGSDSASNLGFRNGEVNGASDYLLFGGNVSDVNESIGFSFDNLMIVPEPGSAALLLLGACTTIARRRRA